MIEDGVKVHMTKSESDFLKILKNTVHPVDNFTLDSPDWDEIISVARKQNLFPLVFDVAEALPRFETVEDKYFIQATGAMSGQMQKTADFLDLYKHFLSAGLAPIVMKGIICRNLYGEKADFRVSGDEDILIEKKDYKRIVTALKDCGYETEEEADSGMEVVQEVTFSSRETGLTVEVHINPFGSKNNIRDKMNEWFRNVFDSTENVIIYDVPIRTMKPTDHLLFLIFHDYKHFTGGGFGVRLMLDTLLFAEKYYERIDWEYIDRALKDTGIAPVYADMVALGNKYLGFTLPVRGGSTCPEELLEDMLWMGTFGNSTKADTTAWTLVSNAVQEANSGNRKDVKGGKVKSELRYLFPSWRTWKTWRPYLKDKPWMLPNEWLRRVGRYLRKETPTHNLSEINESYGIAERRLELLRKYKVL